MMAERWRWSDACRSSGVEVLKESVSLDVRRAFPFRVYGRTRTWGNGG
jgi:hypothetical protein